MGHPDTLECACPFDILAGLRLGTPLSLVLPPMKMLPLAACCAGVLTALPLHAQEPAATPAPTPDARAQSEQILQNPLVQQLLQLVVQKSLELQPKGMTDGNIKTSDIVSIATTLISNLTGGSGGNFAGVSEGDLPPISAVSSTEIPSGETPVAHLTGFAAYSAARFANEPGERRLDPNSRTWITRPWSEAERTRMTTQFQQDYSRLSAVERASWDTPTDGLDPAIAHAWDTSLKSAHLQPSSGLRTGGLSTGGLSTGHLTSGSGTSSVLPPRDFVTPASSFATAAPAPASAAPATAANQPPPADPDDEMRRWSAKIDAQFATEQEARGAAVRTYPDLGVANSAFNTQFRARYAQYKQADPFGFLRGPGWPMKLAIFTDGDLKRQKSGSAVAP